MGAGRLEGTASFGSARASFQINGRARACDRPDSAGPRRGTRSRPTDRVTGARALERPETSSSRARLALCARSPAVSPSPPDINGRSRASEKRVPESRKIAERRASGPEDAVRLDASAGVRAPRTRSSTTRSSSSGASPSTLAPPRARGARGGPRPASRHRSVASWPRRRRPPGGRRQDLAVPLSRGATNVVIATPRATLPEEAPPGGGGDARRTATSELRVCAGPDAFPLRANLRGARAQSRARESGGVLETGAELLGGEGEDGGESADPERAFAFGSPALEAGARGPRAGPTRPREERRPGSRDGVRG